MIRAIAFVLTLAAIGPAMAQTKVSGGDTPPASPTAGPAAPADTAASTPANPPPAANRSGAARQALKALRGDGSDPKDKTPSAPKPADK